MPYTIKGAYVSWGLSSLDGRVGYKTDMENGASMHFLKHLERKKRQML